MNIPYEMQEATEKLLEKRSILNIRNCVSSICERYNNDSGHGKVLVKNEEEAVSYAISRMPGTFGAVKSAAEAVREALEPFWEEHRDMIPKTLTDVGSGTGAAVWAIDSCFELEKINCLERENAMIEIGKHMLSYGDEVMKNATWIREDAAKEGERRNMSADLVTASYIMNELKPEDRDSFLKLLWDLSEKMIILLEPGTKIGFRNISYAREFFIDKGAKVVAPCTHSSPCPLGKDDWCHFSCRMQRSKVQKFVKGGDAPYEDEKFSYVAVLKDAGYDSGEGSRIIRHPVISKGCVELKTCSVSGCEEFKVTSRDKALFKTARKAEWGDRWERADHLDDR
ncbi:MAG: small ribosomal subunit Rsm22 family protein [Lachnospiraceae bacterium]|nr:small ribosomal subunit Rsm22 family protein [Lachnospiraceae bacterium]